MNMTQLQATGYSMQFQHGLLEKTHALVALADVWKRLDQRCSELLREHGYYILGSTGATEFSREYWNKREAQTLVARHFNGLVREMCIADVIDEGRHE